MVREEEIGDTLSGHSTPQQQVEHLIDLALERGAPDNVTVIVVVDGARRSSAVGLGPEGGIS